jgi:hypothetical protein
MAVVLTQVASATRLVRLDAKANQHAPSPGSRTVLDGVRPRSSVRGQPIGCVCQWAKRKDSRVGVQRSGLGRLSADPPEGGWNDPWKLFQGSSVLNHPIALPDSGDNAALRHTEPERFVDPAPLAERKAGTLAEKSPLDLAQGGHSVSGIVDAILDVGRQRSALLAQLRAALESGAEREALTLARRLCGLP